MLLNTFNSNKRQNIEKNQDGRLKVPFFDLTQCHVLMPKPHWQKQISHEEKVTPFTVMESTHSQSWQRLLATKYNIHLHLCVCDCASEVIPFFKHQKSQK